MDALLRMTVERLRIPILVVTGRRAVLPRKRPRLAVVKPFRRPSGKAHPESPKPESPAGPSGRLIDKPR